MTPDREGGGDRDDGTTRERFAGLRHADRAAAPRFDAVISAARGRRVQHSVLPRVGLVVAVAASLFVIATLAVRHPRRATAQKAIADWRSPTDALLEPTAASALLYGTSTLRGSVLDVLGPARLPIKGD